MKIASQQSWPKSQALRSLAASADKVPAGSLIVSDLFAESDPSDTTVHGGSVVAAARSLGFQGPIFYQQSASQPTPELEAGLKAMRLLATPGLSPEQVESMLRSAAVGPALHMLSTGTDEVDRARESGATHSVLNLSSGTCKAQVSKMLYSLAAQAWNGSDPEGDEGPAALDNLAGLFQLDSRKMLDPNPAVFTAERTALLNSVIRFVDQAWNGDPRVQRGREQFSEAVAALEAGRNSVVVAAGNEGLIRPQWEYEGLGPLSVPPDFERNVLDSEKVTLVGATIILDGQEGPARYSSGDQQIDIYASGDKTLGREFDSSAGLRDAGTSVAAPRVGAIMAVLHAHHPELGSSGVESLLEQRFTQGPYGLLDHDAARALLSPAP